MLLTNQLARQQAGCAVFRTPPAAAPRQYRRCIALRCAAAPAPRVAIVGAGVAGPALALLLRKRLGLTASVHEAADAVREVGAGISLAPNGMRVLASLGLARRLVEEARVSPRARCFGAGLTPFSACWLWFSSGS